MSDIDIKRYRYYGHLPYLWEDFISEDGLPNFTIIVKAEADDEDAPGDNGDGWIDIVVDAPAITESMARELIAKHWGISEDAVALREHDGSCDICGGHDC